MTWEPKSSKGDTWLFRWQSEQSAPQLSRPGLLRARVCRLKDSPRSSSPCSFLPRSLSGPLCTFPGSQPPLPGGELEVGDLTCLTAWSSAGWTETSPNADKLMPPDMEEKQGFLSNACLGFQRFPNSVQAMEAVQGTTASRLVTWHPLLAQPFPSWGRAGMDFPHPWPQLPPLAPNYLLPGCVEEERR